MENYEEKYKNAVRQIKDLLERSKEHRWEANYRFLRMTFEQIFPELKEIEDKEIKKVLTDYFKRYQEYGGDTFDKISVDSILAWLEKQGQAENKTQDHNDIETYPDAIQKGWEELGDDGTLSRKSVYDVGFYEGYEFGKKLK